MKIAVITGATGSIGRALTNTCISNGFEVLAVVHKDSARAELLKDIPHCHVLQLDMSEYDCGFEELTKQGYCIALNNPAHDSLNARLKTVDPNDSGLIELSGFTYFFHLAWMGTFGSERDDLDLQLQNVKYSMAAVRFARKLGCATFIGAGSQAEYGRVSVPLCPETPAHPETGYGIAKLCASHMTRFACEQADIKHIWCRILSVYGPYDHPNSIIRTAIADMLQNNETAFTPCEQIWDFMYADDAAKALLKAAENGSHGDVFVLGSGIGRPLKDYISDIARITGYTKEIGFGKRPYNEKQVMFLQADTNSLERIGFSSKTSFEDGIRTILRLITPTPSFTECY